MSERVVVAIGSNLEQPERQVRTAIARLLARFPGHFLASGLYRNPPLGPQDQPDYVNAVVSFCTDQTPQALLKTLQAEETAGGRTRHGERWGPRTLDLDIILFGDRRIATPTLQVPHPRAVERPFVLFPLLEILPDIRWPDGRRADSYAEHLCADTLRRIA